MFAVVESEGGGDKKILCAIIVGGVGVERNIKKRKA